MSRLATLSLTGLALAACVSREPNAPTSPDDPVRLYPAAAALIEGGPDRLVAEVDRIGDGDSFDVTLIRRVAEKTKRSVVSIYTDTRDPVRIQLLPIPIPGLALRATLPGKGLGSGFFIHPEGYLLTNDHVVENAESIRVMTPEGDDLEAVLIARDSYVDLALLKVDPLEEPFPALPMGDSSRAAAGDLALAVGNPLGLGHTVTFGIVSSIGRDLTGVENAAPEVRYLQTDTAINPGSSGGPLVTLDGAWVGVNTSMLANAQSIGFSVPSRTVYDFIAKVLNGRGVRVAPEG